MTGRGTVDSTFEQERNEAIESAMMALAEKPADRVTSMACAYLLRHLHNTPAEDQFLSMAA